MVTEVPEEVVSVQIAFDAMRLFLEQYWESHGRESDDLAILLGALNRDERLQSMPLDPALWDDWVEAVRAVSEGST